MADLTQISDESRRKLPPISPRSKTAGTSSNGNKPVKKKKKKAVAENGLPAGEINDTPTVKRRRKGLSNEVEQPTDDKDTPEGTENAVRKPKRPKRKNVSESETGEQAAGTEENPTSPKRRTPRARKDVSGSKTNLLSKDEPGETTSTPRVKIRKKKKKKVEKVTDEGDYTDSGLAADLTSIEDDVLPMDDTQPQGETTVHHPNSVTVVTLKSQPTNKIFIETDSGFKGQNKTKVARRLAEEKTRPLEMEEPASTTSIEFALKTHRILNRAFLFCHGITAGIALWHIVTVYVLSYHPREDFLIHYQPLALPVQCAFYILLVCCTISAFDRHDVSYPTRRFLRQAFTLQSGAVSTVIYVIALVFSVAIAAEADRINLYYKSPDLWSDPQVSDDKLNIWRSLNTVRGVLTILGWLILSLTPNTDRLSENLKTTDDFLGTNVEMLAVNKNTVMP